MSEDPPYSSGPYASADDDPSDLSQGLGNLEWPESLPFGRPGSLSIAVSAADHRAAIAHQLEQRRPRSEGSVEGRHDHKGSDSDGPMGRERMTPAQSRRKAQNRAAQRAFRERKERHVRELEHKLTQLEAASSSLKSDNACLKLALHRATTENEILRARALGAQASPSSTPLDSPTMSGTDILSAPPFEYVPGAEQSSFDFFSLQRPQRPESMTGAGGLPELKYLPPTTQALHFPQDAMNLQFPPVNRVAMAARSSGRIRLLSAQETWDYIHATPLYQRGLVDLADVVARLKSVAQERAGRGEPAFEEADVKRVVEDAARDASYYIGGPIGAGVTVPGRAPLEDELLPDSEDSPGGAGL